MLDIIELYEWFFGEENLTDLEEGPQFQRYQIHINRWIDIRYHLFEITDNPLSITLPRGTFDSMEGAMKEAKRLSKRTTFTVYRVAEKCGCVLPENAEGPDHRINCPSYNPEV